MIPKKIHYCWLSGDPFPDLIKECLDSWHRVMPDYEIVLWDQNRFDITSNIFVEEACRVKKWAFASDYIRLYAILTEGGVYLDADVFVKKRFDAFLSHDFFTSVEYHDIIVKVLKTHEFLNPDGTSKYPGENIPGIGLQAAIMGGVRGHPFLKECINYYDNLNFIKPDGKYHEEILSPGIYANVAERFGFVFRNKKQVLDHNIIIYPSETFAVEPSKISPDVFAVHMTAGSWREIKRDSLFYRIRMTLQYNNMVRKLFRKRPIKRAVEFCLKGKGLTTLQVFSLRDILLITIDLGNKTNGKYQYNLTNPELPPRMYICRIQQNDKFVDEQYYINKYNTWESN